MILSIFLGLMLVLAWSLLFIIFSEFVAFLRTRVPFVPTHAGDVKFIVEKLKLSPTDVFYDLGSGNGKVVFLVEKLSGAKTVGFELGWWTILFAKIKRWWLQFSSLPEGRARERLQFKNQDFFQANWSGANIIYCYLYPPLMGRIEEKFLAELKPGSIAIVRDFPFPTMAYAEKYYLPKDHEIYVYRI
ncbi:MAG: hypothetical protein AAB729_05840 [Patescibacteria group bacterium]